MVICASCVTDRHRAPIPPTAPIAVADKDAFLDLRDGYRLRVVTPLTKSGSFLVKTTAAGVQGNDNQLDVALRVDEDFVGYETSYYLVTEEKQRVFIRFASAERMIGGKATPAATGAVRLFEMPRGIRNARLMYLIRQSAADHDMAFVGAGSARALDLLTERVRASATACRPARGLHCAWIPAGIAVRAEVRDPAGAWQPVR